MRVYNQFTETFSIRELAHEVQIAGKELGLAGRDRRVENPRTEAAGPLLQPGAHEAAGSGLRPTLLSEALVTDTLRTLMKYRDRVIIDAIAPRTTWQ